MTISRKVQTNRSIATLLNLSTAKRTVMVLSNPACIDKAEWYWHLHFFGLSFVYFSLFTADADVLFA